MFDVRLARGPGALPQVVLAWVADIRTDGLGVNIVGNRLAGNPLFGSASSLKAATAATVVLYESVRQRTAGGRR
ncbi:hypothetical protein ACN27F_20325 [Solwaraspora sp. WMMB335]|uniref:hypothetical protein n=1 Tax=Solwaraspora sp. WMMB335 TaxID=3404118 RepID=UPI003B94AF91